jgi:hypothetical protein
MKDVWERVEGLEVMVDCLKEKSELFDRLIPILMEYNKLRDEERDFVDSRPGRDSWSEDIRKEHDELLEDIARKRNAIGDILREVECDQSLRF